MNYNLIKFEEALKKINISLDSTQINQFLKYYELMIQWNKVMNLTGITEFEEVLEKHFLDSLCLVKAADLKKSCRILDLGTGAGFPGIPLKIAFPDIDIVLMDSLNKRIRFLNEVIEVLNLKKITAIHGRAEEMAKKSEYRETFDFCVSRAVANLSSLSEYCIPFVKKEGFFISYKSGEADNEITQAKHAVYLLGGQITDIIKYQIPGTDMNRSLVKIVKIKNTPKIYPRKAGTPSKNPLK